jgi:hypothetical protein
MQGGVVAADGVAIPWSRFVPARTIARTRMTLASASE